MPDKIQLILHGASGRMGQEILSLVKEKEGEFQILFSLSAGDSYPEVIFPDEKQMSRPLLLFIDFSSPEGFRNGLSYCFRVGIPFLSGTTGLMSDDFSLLKKASEKIPTFWSPNMSLGIAVLKKALTALRPLNKTFDFQVEEIHHKRKKDAPSGTAILLQNALNSSLNFDSNSNCTIPPPISLRGGGILGQHKIYALGEEEYLTFEHTAISRRVFARGALHIASWLVMQKPGEYNMDAYVSC